MTLTKEPCLPEPHFRVGMLENRKHCVILRQRYGEFHQALVEIWKIAAAAAGLWLIGIGVGV
jgi:hypothetical protein